MVRRAAAIPATAAIAGVAALVAGAAPAQVPDERAAAFAFAAALERFATGVEPLTGVSFDEPPERACAFRVRRRLPEHRWDEVNLLNGIEADIEQARAVYPVLRQLSLDLHGVPTADPDLRAGRTAMRRVRRGWAGVAALPEPDVCAEVGRYVDAGHRLTPAMRRIRRALRGRELAQAPDIMRRAERMEARMVELGVPEDVLDPIGGDDGAGR